jgi:cell division protein FtsQ
MAVYERLLSDLDSSGQHISEQISEIDLSDAQDARVWMSEQGTDILAHFGEDRYLERYQRYKAHIAEWRQQYPRLAGVDLRYDSQVVLEMTPGTDAVAAALDGTQTPAGTGDGATVPQPPAITSKLPAGAGAANGAEKPPAEKQAAEQEAPVKPAAVNQVAVKQAAVSKPKTAAKKAVTIEELAARQRAAHERAAKAKAARDKAEKDKKRAANHDTALNGNRPSSNRPASAAVQGG